MTAFDKLYAAVDRLVLWLVAFGAAIIVVQVFWISYGVFVRYAMGAPDGMVTEATALLLVPVAFAGLAYALREDAYPKVTLLVERFPKPLQLIIARINLLIKIAIGSFFATAATMAAFRSYDSGAASEILLWPRYLFWIPVAVSLCTFSLFAVLRFIRFFRTGGNTEIEE